MKPPRLRRGKAPPPARLARSAACGELFDVVPSRVNESGAHCPRGHYGAGDPGADVAAAGLSNRRTRWYLSTVARSAAAIVAVQVEAAGAAGGSRCATIHRISTPPAPTAPRPSPGDLSCRRSLVGRLELCLLVEGAAAFLVTLPAGAGGRWGDGHGRRPCRNRKRVTAGHPTARWWSSIESEHDLIRLLAAPMREPAPLAHDQETALRQHTNRRGVVARSATVKRTACSSCKNSWRARVAMPRPQSSRPIQ